MSNASGKAAAGLESGAAIGATVAAIGTAAAAANAVPIAGQVAAAALGLTAMFVKLFGGKRKEKERKAAEYARQMQARRRAHLQQYSQMIERGPTTQAAPQSGQQGMGTFQETQAGEGPIYSSGGGMQP